MAHTLAQSVLPDWTAWAGLVITWVVFAIGLGKFHLDLKNAKQNDEHRRKERDAELEAMARRVCREFAFEGDVMKARDERIRELADSRIDKAFADRSSSFVDADRYEADQRATERRLESLESSIRDNTRELGKLGGQITSEVTRNITAFLSTKIIAGKQ